MNDYDFSKIEKRTVLYSYFIRKCIGKSDNGSPIYYLTKTFIEDKDKLKQIKGCFNEFYEKNNKDYLFEKILREIDMDFESGNAEQSFSTGGNIGYGLTLGTRYQITQRYAVFTDLQYNHFSSLDLKNENGTGKISNIKYNPIALRFGLAFNF